MSFLQARRPTKLYGVTCLLLGAAGVVGCGSGSPFDYVKVSGVVQYDDGTPIPFAEETRLVFESKAPPVSETIHARPAVAYVGVDGVFSSATSYKYGDGLVRGEHKVILSASDAEGNALIPPEYGDIKETPLLINTSDSPLVIKIRRP